MNLFRLFRKKRKKIGLALGSGGPRGLAHIGVIKALVENNIPIDYIAGASSGALIGGMYAKFQDIYKVESHFEKLTYKDLFKIFSDPHFAHGVLKGEKALRFLKNWVGNTKIEKLPIPFSAVATDLITGQTVPIEKGELALAIRTSASLPVFFRPVKIGKKILVDGGNSMPVPVEVVKKMGADIVIAVDLDHCYIHSKNQPRNIEKMSMTEVAERALDILSYTLAKENTKNADIVISPDVNDIGWNRVINGSDIIAEGEKAGRKMVEEIMKIL
uniref:Patatin family protein n=1 Tax=candidate division CPR3 bacterium TaxID=2268181 RepID=A0A7C4M2I1_UNCC3